MNYDEDSKKVTLPRDFFIYYSLMAGHIDAALNLLEEIQEDIKNKNGISVVMIGILRSAVKSSQELIEDCNIYLYPEEEI